MREEAGSIYFNSFQFLLAIELFLQTNLYGNLMCKTNKSGIDLLKVTVCVHVCARSLVVFGRCYLGVSVSSM